MAAPLHLRRDAEHLADPLPALLVAAKQLAANVSLGIHGCRQSGMGESFWQYRQALPGDAMSAIDWRRSARSDTVFIREREWEAAHTVAIWADNALSMDFRGSGETTKGARANLLALALSVLLDKGGERVAFPATIAADPRHGERHLQRIAQALSDVSAERPEYGTAPDLPPLKPATTVLFSDFLGPDDQVFPALERAAKACHCGYLVRILDPQEESFPFDGRVVFESMGGGVSFETHRARALQEAYRARLAERTERLRDFAQRTGWHMLDHRSGESAQPVLLALFSGIGGRE